MKVCFVADARSPIAQNWIRHFVSIGHEVHVFSSHPCCPSTVSPAFLHILPTICGALRHEEPAGGGGKRTRLRGSALIETLRTKGLLQHAMRLHHWLGCADVFRLAGHLRRKIERLRPDLVHALRIPFEGLLASEALRAVDIPLAISVWGNDFTLHANQSCLVRFLTRRAMRRANALHTDCHRDLQLAQQLGFSTAKPSAVLPSNGGIQCENFYAGQPSLELLSRWRIPAQAAVIVNPRGLRGYVRTDTFFHSIPLVLAHRPDAVFLGIGMRGNRSLERLAKRLGVQHAVRLLPSMPHKEMAELFRAASVVVSPSEHDGTPNTLLEAMSCGAFPVAGDIESIREWIQSGLNGLLCNPADPESLAQAILHALDNQCLRGRAASYNRKLIAERAEYHKVMARAEEFYGHLIHQASDAYEAFPC